MSVSIIISCHNEESVIAQVIQSFYEAVSKEILDFEFIVIDDASTDQTGQLLNNLSNRYPYLKVLQNERNIGHGPSLLKGYSEAVKDYVLQVDGDGQLAAEDVVQFIKALPNYDFILGRRHKRKDPFFRRMLTAVIETAIALLFQKRFKDPNCPYRLIKNSVLRSWRNEMEYGHVAPNIMMSILAYQRGSAIKRVPIRHFPPQNQRMGWNQFRLWRIAGQGFAQLLAFKFRDRSAK